MCIDAGILLLAIGAPVVALEDPTVLTDIRIGYAVSHITAARVGGRDVEPTFTRHNITLEIGIDSLTLGAIVQRATRSQDTTAGTPETGLMATVGYSRLLTDWLTVDGFARIGVTPGHNDGQPLYATDTDLRLKLVAFEPDGWGAVSNAVFPSAYVGLIVNRYARVQAIGGAGLWFRGFGAYATVIHAFNGVADPMQPGDRSGEAFAAVDNAVASVSGSYDLDIAQSDRIHIEVRKNFAIRNAGNDIVGIVELMHFFE